MRIRFGSEGWQESAEIEFERCFGTGHLSPGWYTIRVEVARQGDNSWSSPTVAEASYELTGAPPPPPPPSCTIESLSADPPSPQPPGTSVSIYGRASCDTGVRAIRFKVDGGIIYELGAPEATATWNSPGSPGSHTITVEAAGWGDNEWAYAASRSIAYELQSAPSPPSCSVQSLSVSPTSGPAGTMFAISGSGSCDTGVRAIRFKIDGGIIYELGAPSASTTWNSSGAWEGTHTATIEVAGWGDDNWLYAASSSKTFEVTGPQPPPPGPSISQVIFNPSGDAEVGQTVGIHIKVESSNPGAIRIYIPCGSIAHFEHTVPEYDTTWSTGGCGAGSQNVRVCARHVDDPNWENPTCTDRSYTLSAPPPPSKPAPSAEFWSDASTIQEGQCTGLHWRTTNATAVDIDGSPVAASGDWSVCPTVTKHYSLKAVGPGGEATRSISIVVGSSAPPPEETVPPPEPSGCVAEGGAWSVGKVVGLKAETKIYEGSGFGYRVHTKVPQDNWLVKIIGGPRYVDGWEWWDTSRQACDPAGGTGWVPYRKLPQHSEQPQNEIPSQEQGPESDIGESSEPQPLQLPPFDLNPASEAAGSAQLEPGVDTDELLQRALKTGTDLYQIGATVYVAYGTTCAGLPFYYQIPCILVAVADQATQPVVEFLHDRAQALGILD